MCCSEIFWNSVLITASGLFLAMIGVLYKSKCKIIRCCGCIEIDRDVNLEEKIDEMELQHHEEQKM